MRRRAIPIVLASAFIGRLRRASTNRPTRWGRWRSCETCAPDVQEVKVEQGLDQAMQHYRRFLERSPETPMTPEAMRRLADLQLEKQFGIRTGETKPRGNGGPGARQGTREHAGRHAQSGRAAAGAGRGESDQDFERRTTAESGIPASGDTGASSTEVPGADAAPKGPLEAIALYNQLLTEYPNYKDSDQVLYQMARAYDELGRTEEAMATMERLIRANPNSVHFDEVQFRRGEYFFTRRRFRDAENAYSRIINLGARSSYLRARSLQARVDVLQAGALRGGPAEVHGAARLQGVDRLRLRSEAREGGRTPRRRYLSSHQPELQQPRRAGAVQEYFSTSGNRSYEDRVYSNLGEHYLAKLRYDDAAKTYKAFVALYPFHRAAPRFSMRVVETFTQGGFPKLVLESKREFASKYGLKAEYWRHFKPEESPEVLAYLKTNLKDLATHYHAEYQRRAGSGREARELSRGAPMVRRLSRVLPDGRRFAANQLPAGGPSPREQGFRRGGQTV